MTALQSPLWKVPPLHTAYVLQRNDLFGRPNRSHTTIACRPAMDYPDLVDGLVVIAPALALREEKPGGAPIKFFIHPLYFMNEKFHVRLKRT